MRATVGPNSALVIEAVDALRGSLPFMLRGLDVDNGSEFLNDALVRYCAMQRIEFTRSRPYHKNDQAWIEQKNGAVVRRLVGYRRFEGMAAVEALSRLYAASRLFVNFFQPSFKLKEKTRLGSRVIKRYHAPETPSARLLASSAISEQVKSQLRGIAETLDPLQLLDEIRRMQSHLALLSEGGHPHTPIAQQDDLSRFLGGLCTAWRQTEIRATHCKIRQTAALLADKERSAARLRGRRSSNGWKLIRIRPEKISSTAYSISAQASIRMASCEHYSVGSKNGAAKWRANSSSVCGKALSVRRSLAKRKQLLPQTRLTVRWTQKSGSTFFDGVASDALSGGARTRAPTRSSMPSCSRPSGTLRAADAVVRRRTILDGRCARRAFAMRRSGRKDGPDRTKGWGDALATPGWEL